MSQGIIRKAKISDLGGIRDIYALYYSAPEDIAYFVGHMQESINESSVAVGTDLHYLVAEDNGKIVGLLGFCTPRKRLLEFATSSHPVELSTFFVHPKRMGIGKALLTQMLNIARIAEYSEILVRSADKFQDSWPFYDKMGFERVGQLDSDGYIDQIWRMKL